MLYLTSFFHSWKGGTIPLITRTAASNPVRYAEITLNPPTLRLFIFRYYRAGLNFTIRNLRLLSIAPLTFTISLLNMLFSLLWLLHISFENGNLAQDQTLYPDILAPLLSTCCAVLQLLTECVISSELFVQFFSVTKFKLGSTRGHLSQI